MKPAPSLTTDPISSLIWRIALPMSIGMFFNTMFNVVDTYYAGKIGTEALAALALSFPVFFIILSVGSGISQGTTALLANALGEGNTNDCRRYFAQAIFFVIIGALVMAVAGWLTSPFIFKSLGASGSYLQTCLEYMNVILAGSVLMLLPIVLNSALSSQGNTIPYRNYLIAGFIANCLLNPLFILGWWGLPKMGVAGLALATLVVHLGGIIYLWVHLQKSELFKKITPRELAPDWAVLKKIAGQAVPAGLNMLTIAIGMFVINWFVQHFDKEAIAAAGVAMRVEQIILMPTIGLNFAALSIIGQNHGAKLPHRVREAWMTNIKFGAIIMFVGGFVLYFLREPGLRFFTDDEAVIAIGYDCLLVSAVTLAAYPILFVTVFAFQGLKQPMIGLWIGLYRQLIAPILIIHTLTFTLAWGLWGIWWGISIVTWSAALFMLVLGWRKIGKEQ